MVISNGFPCKSICPSSVDDDPDGYADSHLVAFSRLGGGKQELNLEKNCKLKKKSLTNFSILRVITVQNKLGGQKINIKLSVLSIVVFLKEF